KAKPARRASSFLAHVRAGFEAVPNNLVQLRTNGGVTETIDDLAGKGGGQNGARAFGADAPRAEIKNRFFIELTDGRAVRAFDIVSVDFQLRLGIDRRVVGKQQVFICLFRVGFLGGLPDQDASMKHAFGASVENAVVILV